LKIDQFTEIRLMTNDYLRANSNVVNLLALAWEEVRNEEATQSFARPVLLVEIAVDEMNKPLTLDRYLSTNKSNLLLADKALLLCDVANGLAAIHALSVVHGDLKPSNILIFPGRSKGRMVAKLSDFGFSSIESSNRTLGRGTFLWTAPECLEGATDELKELENTITRDFYGFGLLMW
jgi:serine/threonine protein kinase